MFVADVAPISSFRIERALNRNGCGIVIESVDLLPASERPFFVIEEVNPADFSAVIRNISDVRRKVSFLVRGFLAEGTW